MSEDTVRPRRKSLKKRKIALGTFPQPPRLRYSSRKINKTPVCTCTRCVGTVPLLSVNLYIAVNHHNTYDSPHHQHQPQPTSLSTPIMSKNKTPPAPVPSSRCRIQAMHGLCATWLVGRTAMRHSKPRTQNASPSAMVLGRFWLMFRGRIFLAVVRLRGQLCPEIIARDFTHVGVVRSRQAHLFWGASEECLGDERRSCRWVLA